MQTIIIGSACFNARAGSIDNLRTSGVVDTVSYNALGHFKVNLNQDQDNYDCQVTCGDCQGDCLGYQGTVPPADKVRDAFLIRTFSLTTQTPGDCDNIMALITKEVG